MGKRKIGYATRSRRPTKIGRKHYAGHKRRTYIPRGIRTASAINFNETEKAYINSVTNPFGKNASGSYDVTSINGRILDSGAPLSRSQFCTYNFTFGIGTNEMLIKMQDIKQCSHDSHLGAEMAWSAGASATPTNDENYSTLQWTIARTYCQAIRLVGAAIKVTAVSSPDDTAGILRGGITRSPLRTDETTWNTYQAAEDDMDDNLYSLQEGMTVRWVPEGNSDYEWTHGVQDKDPDEWDLTNCRMPCIRLSGGKTSTKIQVAIVYHLEIIDKINYSPGLTPSPVSVNGPFVHFVFFVSRKYAREGCGSNAEIWCSNCRYVRFGRVCG